MPHRALVWTCRHDEAAGANGRGREADGLAQDDARRERSSAVCFLRLRAGANAHPATDGGAITGSAIWNRFGDRLAAEPLAGPLFF